MFLEPLAQRQTNVSYIYIEYRDGSYNPHHALCVAAKVLKLIDARDSSMSQQARVPESSKRSAIPALQKGAMESSRAS